MLDKFDFHMMVSVLACIELLYIIAIIKFLPCVSFSYDFCQERNRLLHFISYIFYKEIYKVWVFCIPVFTFISPLVNIRYWKEGATHRRRDGNAESC